MAEEKCPAPFVETIKGVNVNDLMVMADEGVVVATVNPFRSRQQVHLDRQGLRRLIEALETAEKHLTLNQWGRR